MRARIATTNSGNNANSGSPNRSPDPRLKLAARPGSKKKSVQRDTLSTERIIGILLSISLSFVIVLSSMAAVYFASPYIRNYLRVILSFEYLKRSPTYLPIETVTPEEFEADYFSQKPLLVSTGPSESSMQQIITFFEAAYFDDTVTLRRMSKVVDALSTGIEQPPSWGPEWGKQSDSSNFEQLSTTLHEYRGKKVEQGEYDRFIFTDFNAANSIPAIQNLVNPLSSSVFLVSKAALHQHHSNSAASKQATQTFWQRWLPFSWSSLFSSTTKTKPKPPGGQKVTLFSNDGSQCILSDLPTNMSLPFHQLDQSLNILASGKLHWILYPPERIPRLGFDPAESLRDWLNREYLALWSSQTPVEVIQLPGQALYVPEGWYRAYVSDSEDSSVLLTLPHSLCEESASTSGYCNFKEAMQRLERKDLKSAHMFFNEALKSSAPDYKSHLRLGLLQQEMQDVAGAEESFRQAISRNYKNPMGYLALLRLYESSKEYRDPEAVNAEIVGVLKLARQINISRLNPEMLSFFEKYL